MVAEGRKWPTSCKNRGGIVQKGEMSGEYVQGIMSGSRRIYHAGALCRPMCFLVSVRSGLRCEPFEMRFIKVNSSRHQLRVVPRNL